MVFILFFLVVFLALTMLLHGSATVTEVSCHMGYHDTTLFYIHQTGESKGSANLTCATALSVPEGVL